MAIEPSPGLRALLEQRPGESDLVLGVRPIDLGLSWSPMANAVGTGHVTLVENLGDEQIVVVRVEDQSVESVIDASITANVGDQVWLLVRPDRVHVFDRASGRSLAA
jgi:multiple sugar transport system ATP-binding protein